MCGSEHFSSFFLGILLLSDWISLSFDIALNSKVRAISGSFIFGSGRCASVCCMVSTASHFTLHVCVLYGIDPCLIIITSSTDLNSNCYYCCLLVSTIGACYFESSAKTHIEVLGDAFARRYDDLKTGVAPGNIIPSNTLPLHAAKNDGSCTSAKNGLFKSVVQVIPELECILLVIIT